MQVTFLMFVTVPFVITKIISFVISVTLTGVKEMTSWFVFMHVVKDNQIVN